MAVEFYAHIVILMVLPFPLPPFVTVSSVILVESTNVSVSLNITVSFHNSVFVFIISVMSDSKNHREGSGGKHFCSVWQDINFWYVVNLGSCLL